MKKEERSALTNENMLFTLLTAIVKKSGGEIRISENEMDSVTKKDMMMMVPYPAATTHITFMQRKGILVHSL